MLVTDLGPLDLLGAIEGGRGYEELVPFAASVAVAGATVRVLRLTMLAELKRGSTAPKDRLALAIMDETLRRGGG